MTKNASSPTPLEDRIMQLYIILNGKPSDGGSCTIEVKTENWGNPLGIACYKDGHECWFISKEDLLFDYVTRFM